MKIDQLRNRLDAAVDDYVEECRLAQEGLKVRLQLIKLTASFSNVDPVLLRDAVDEADARMQARLDEVLS